MTELRKKKVQNVAGDVINPATEETVSEQLLIARKTWILLEQVIRELKILREYNILITDEEITEKDLRDIN